MRLRAIRARLDESLFPDPPAASSSWGRGERLLLVTSTLALGIVLQLFRLGGSTPLHSIWAEDGQVFLQGALDKGFWDAAFTPYGGYLVLVPRLIGEAAALLPLRDAAATTAILAAAVVTVSGLAVWQASAGHIANPYLRGLLAAVTVLSPVAGLESIDSGAYVLWYMLFATFWLLLWRPRSPFGTAFASLFILATALTTPGVWFFAPLAALRTVAIRGRRDLAIVASFWIGAVAQVPVLALNQEAVVTPQWSADIWTDYLQRVLDGSLLGLRLGGAGWDRLGWALLVVLLAGAIAGFVLGFKRSTPRARWVAAIALLTSFVLFVVSLYQRAVATPMLWPAGMHVGNGSRYAIVPALLMISAALVLVDSSSRRQRGPFGLSLAGVGAISVLLLSIATSFYAGDSAARGTPSWNSALDRAASACVADDLSTVRIPTSPPEFGVQVPCDRIASAP